MSADRLYLYSKSPVVLPGKGFDRARTPIETVCCCRNYPDGARYCLHCDKAVLGSAA